MAVHTLDIPAFRAAFPEFAAAGAYPDAAVQVQWDMATAFICPVDGPLIADAQLQAALNYMTAHLLKSATMLAAGQTSVVLRGSTVDKVQVQLEPPPLKSGWQWWLSTTPYGAALWALLSVKAAGGFYVGGAPEQSAFRGVAGRFGR